MQACKAVAIVWLISLSVHTSAQGLMDWLTDPTGTATKIVVDEVSKQANNAWEGILNDKIQESLSKDAQKLADFRIDTTALDSIDKMSDTKLRTSIENYIYTLRSKLKREINAT